MRTQSGKAYKYYGEDHCGVQFHACFLIRTAFYLCKIMHRITDAVIVDDKVSTEHIQLH